MEIATVATAVFVTASLLSLVVLSFLLGQMALAQRAPRKVWTAQRHSGSFVEFVPEGSKKGYRIELSQLAGRGLTIGRDPEQCDLVIRDWYVSSRHARIWVDSSGLHIEDLRSTNGSWSNDRRIEKASFSFGETIRLGRTSFRLLAVEG